MRVTGLVVLFVTLAVVQCFPVRFDEYDTQSGLIKHASTATLVFLSQEESALPSDHIAKLSALETSINAQAAARTKQLDEMEAKLDKKPTLQAEVDSVAHDAEESADTNAAVFGALGDTDAISEMKTLQKMAKKAGVTGNEAPRTAVQREEDRLGVVPRQTKAKAAPMPVQLGASQAVPKKTYVQKLDQAEASVQATAKKMKKRIADEERKLSLQSARDNEVNKKMKGLRSEFESQKLMGHSVQFELSKDHFVSRAERQLEHLEAAASHIVN